MGVEYAKLRRMCTKYGKERHGRSEGSIIETMQVL